jgi:hypothetical protein
MAKANGRILKIKHIVILMKGSTAMIRKMGMGFLYGKVEMYTKVIILMTKETATEKCSGQMVHHIKENGKKVYNMVMVK